LAQKFAVTEPPLRAELFSSDQMKQHGKVLADSHQLGLGGAPDRLLTRLAENEGVLIGTRNLLTTAVKANRRIAPAGEWLRRSRGTCWVLPDRQGLGAARATGSKKGDRFIFFPSLVSLVLEIPKFSFHSLGFS